MPVIGYLGPESPEPFASRVRAFRDGLGEAGYVEGRNVAIEFRWAEGRYDRLPTLAILPARRNATEKSNCHGEIRSSREMRSDGVA